MRPVSLDLTPFGFTPTESLVYATLLSLGPSTGYAVAAAIRRARANTYAALEGLLQRGAALKEPGRPARYRAVGADALLTRLAADQGAALDRLETLLRGAPSARDPLGDAVEGQRPVANVLLRLVGRATAAVRAVLTPALLADTLPAWRRAAGLDSRLWVLDPPAAWSAPVPVTGTVTGDAWHDRWPGAPAVAVVDDRAALCAVHLTDGLTGWWSTHPAFVGAAAGALRSLTA